MLILARKGSLKTLEVILKWLSPGILGKTEQTAKIMYGEFKDETNETYLNKRRM